MPIRQMRSSEARAAVWVAVFILSTASANVRLEGILSVNPNGPDVILVGIDQKCPHGTTEVFAISDEIIAGGKIHGNAWKLCISDAAEKAR